MGYTAPLRTAALWLFQRPLPFDIAALATNAGVSVHRARQYATVLVGRHIAVDHGGLLSPGAFFQAWQLEAPRSRPGGDSTTYEVAHHQRQSRTSDRRLVYGARLRAAREARGWSARRMGKELGISHVMVLHIETGKRLGAEAFKRAQALGLV